MMFEKSQRFGWLLFLLWSLFIAGCCSVKDRPSPDPTPGASGQTWHDIVPGQTTKEQVITILATLLPAGTELVDFDKGVSWRVQLSTELAGQDRSEINKIRFDQGIVELLQVWEPNGTLGGAVSTYGAPSLVLGASKTVGEDPRRRVGFAYPEQGLVLMTGWGPLWDYMTQEVKDAGMGIIPQPDMVILETFYLSPQSLDEFRATFSFGRLGYDPNWQRKGPWTRPWEGWGQ